METVLTSKNYQSAVTDSAKPVLIDFWATWCGPCKMLAPVLEKVAAERTDISVCKCNVDEEGELATRFGVEVIPTLVVLKGGKIVAKTSGYRDHAGLTRFIDEAIK